MAHSHEHIKEQEAAFWDQQYRGERPEYDEGRDCRFHDAFKDPMRQMPGPARILEVASGIRLDGLELARAGHHIVELDISPEAIRRAQTVYRRHDLPAEFVVGDGENLPFANESFDAVFTAASFHHFPDLIRALSEMKRVTKKGGYVILGVEPNAWPYATIFLLLKPLQRLIRTLHPRAHDSIADDECSGFTSRRLRTLFSTAGLSIVDLDRAKYVQEWVEQGMRLFGRLIGKKPHTSRTLIRALDRIDQTLKHVPLIRCANWHWNVISRKV